MTKSRLYNVPTEKTPNGCEGAILYYTKEKVHGSKKGKKYRKKQCS